MLSWGLKNTNKAVREQQRLSVTFKCHHSQFGGYKRDGPWTSEGLDKERVGTFWAFQTCRLGCSILVGWSFLRAHIEANEWLDTPTSTPVRYLELMKKTMDTSSRIYSQGSNSPLLSRECFKEAGKLPKTSIKLSLSRKRNRRLGSEVSWGRWGAGQNIVMSLGACTPAEARQGMESHLCTVQENCHLRVKYKHKLRLKIDVM